MGFQQGAAALMSGPRMEGAAPRRAAWLAFWFVQLAFLLTADSASEDIFSNGGAEVSMLGAEEPTSEVSLLGESESGSSFREWDDTDDVDYEMGSGKGSEAGDKMQQKAEAWTQKAHAHEARAKKLEKQEKGPCSARSSRTSRSQGGSKSSGRCCCQGQG